MSNACELIKLIKSRVLQLQFFEDIMPMHFDVIAKYWILAISLVSPLERPDDLHLAVGEVDDIRVRLVAVEQLVREDILHFLANVDMVLLTSRRSLPAFPGGVNSW